MVGPPRIFDLANRYAALSAAGEPLKRVASYIDLEIFCGPLIAVLRQS